MAKEEWGVKRVCPETGKRFYDLNADPIVSPYTGEVVVIETGKTRTMQADAADAQSKKDEDKSEEDTVVAQDTVDEIEDAEIIVEPSDTDAADDKPAEEAAKT